MQKANGGFLINILLALAIAHGINDGMQSLVISNYAVIKEHLNLTYTQIGIIAFVYQFSSSLLQPAFGYLFDRKPIVWLLPFGQISTMIGLLLIAYGNSMNVMLLAVFFAGMGSAILHPLAAKMTSLSAGNRKGFAQSIFQLGGTVGFSLGPLLAALVVRDLSDIAKLSVVAIFAFIILIPSCRWYNAELLKPKPKKSSEVVMLNDVILTKFKITAIFSLLIFLIFSKNFYLTSFSYYYTFYLMEKFAMSLANAQLLLFIFLFSNAIGLLLGGIVSDKYGRKMVICLSFVCSAPFALIMPYASLAGTVILSVIIGLIISSAFSAILLYAQALMPSRVGFVSGVFFGVAFGFAAISSAALGKIADLKGIDFVYHLCAFMPLLGIFGFLLPKIRNLKR
ncbi:MAG: MFS transporter [Opitutales bacterium]